jgi:hypothetical protein
MTLFAPAGTVPPPSLWFPFGDATRGLSAATDATAMSTLAGVANRLDLMPLYLGGAGLRIASIGAQVTTAVASQFFRAVLYEVNPRQPTQLIRRAQTGDLSTAATGHIREALAFRFHPRRRYMVGIHHSATATLRALPLAALWPIASSLTSTAQMTLLRYTETFANGAPQILTVTPAAMVSSVAPAVLMEWA